VGGILLGIDIGGTKIAMATAAASGDVLLTRRFATGAGDGADAVLARILAAAEALVEETVREWAAPLVGVGVVCPGVIRRHGVLLAPNNPGWDRVRLRDTFEAAFPDVHVAVMNDVKAGALAELTHGALAGADSGVFINLGTGLAAAIVVNGAIVDGGHGAAGEIGYQVLVGGADSATDPQPGFADGHAPLEEAVSGRAIADRASAVLGRQVTTAEAFALAASERVVRGVVDDAVGLLAAHVANLVVALDPERVVLGGGMSGQADVILPPLTAALRRTVPFPPEVRLAELPDDAPLIGALVIAGQPPTHRAGPA
jgi:glucokinase